MTNLHVIREHTLQDIPAVLREIADSVEAGNFGKPVGCVVVLDAEALNVFYTGSGEAGPNAYILLHAGAAKMMQGVMAEKLA